MSNTQSAARAVKPGTPADLQAAVDLAAKSDIAIVVVGQDNNYEGEELDAASNNLTGDQDKLVAAIAAVNKHTRRDRQSRDTHPDGQMAVIGAGTGGDVVRRR